MEKRKSNFKTQWTQLHGLMSGGKGEQFQVGSYFKSDLQIG